MKLTKLSLVAVLAVSAAFAGESTISGDAKLFYGTTDANNLDMFDKYSSYGNAAASLDYSREVTDGVTVNAGVTGVSTLGLEHTLVGATWVDQGGLDDRIWIDTANLAVNPIDKTTMVVGRQALDTPLAFTETWNIAQNTFDAAVLVDSHIPETTLIGAWVGRGNGDVNGWAVAPTKNVQGGMTKYGALSADQSALLGVSNNGAYAAAAITKAIPMTVVQLWYYNVVNQANAIWAQADVDVNGIGIGLQYANIMLQDPVKNGFTAATGATAEDSSAMAVKVGYAKDALSAYAAYSKVEADGLVYVGNTATSGAFGGQSKLYTEAWWNHGFVGQADAQAIAVNVGYDLGAAQLAAQYTTVTNDSDANSEMDEIALTATTKVGPADATLAFINTSSDTDIDGDGTKDLDGNTVQVYLTVPFSL